MKDMSQVLRTMPFIVGEVRDPNEEYALLSVANSPRACLFQSTIHTTSTKTSISMKYKEILGGNE